MRLSARCVLVVMVAALPQVHAQDAAPAATFKVDFNIRDAADVSKAPRRYTMLLDNDGKGGVFKVGDRVPVMTGTQTTYVDVGMNIDTHLHEVNGKVLLNSSIDMSTARAGGASPTIAQTRVSIYATVTPGTPTLVASIDDPATQHKLDVEATVTRLP